MLDKNIKTKSKSEQAYDILEEMIVTLKLPPGSNWSEKELSEMIGIGRMPVREAIKKLESTHLLSIVPRLGIHISEITLENFFLQMEVRRLLERLIATRAARFSTPAEREHFLKLAEDYEEATSTGDTLRAVKIDNEFNKFIADCARNKFAKEAIRALHSLARRLYFMQYNIDTDLAKTINDAHCALMRAVASGDEVKSAKQSDYLLDQIEKLYKRKLDTFM